MFVVLHCKDLVHVSELITALGGGMRFAHQRAFSFDTDRMLGGT